MKNKYCVLKAPRSRFLVKEMKTSFIVKVCYRYEDAVKISDFLENGGGFSGETPFFFVYRKEQLYA